MDQLPQRQRENDDHLITLYLVSGGPSIFLTSLEYYYSSKSAKDSRRFPSSGSNNTELGPYYSSCSPCMCGSWRCSVGESGNLSSNTWISSHTSWLFNVTNRRIEMIVRLVKGLLRGSGNGAQTSAHFTIYILGFSLRWLSSRSSAANSEKQLCFDLKTWTCSSTKSYLCYVHLLLDSTSLLCISDFTCANPEPADQRADKLLGVTPFLTMISMAGENRQTSCIILFLLLCSLSCRALAVYCNANDSKALLKFKAQLLDPNGELASWVGSSDCGLWKVPHR